MHYIVMHLSLLANYTVNLTILPVYILPSAVVIVLQKTESRIGSETTTTTEAGDVGGYIIIGIAL